MNKRRSTVNKEIDSQQGFESRAATPWKEARSGSTTGRKPEKDTIVVCPCRVDNNNKINKTNSPQPSSTTKRINKETLVPSLLHI